ncbi:MAG: adenylosuccinate synthetase [Polyangiaceae bacterium]
MHRSSAWVVAGLGFGDEGKGALVDALVREEGASLVVRFNGGPQAAHHVVTADGRMHCFAQLGAGTFVPRVRTFLSRFVALEPLALARELAVLADLGVDDARERLHLDPRCVVVTPAHRAMNRVRELTRGAARHGSVGLGVGEALLDAERGALPTVTVADAADEGALVRKLTLLARMKLDLAEQLLAARATELDPALETELETELAALRDRDLPSRFASALIALARSVEVTREVPLGAGEHVVFEGAQGMLLDRDYGFFPHVTPSRTGFANALELAREAHLPAPRCIGVLRAYATRHGAGPFPTEARELELPELHNGTHRYQGAFRVGWFDAVAARYAFRSACAAAGLAGCELAISCLDRLARRGATAPLRVAVAYDLDLAPGEVADLAARAAFTERLAHVRPSYEALPAFCDADDPAAERFLARIEELVGAPVSRTSWGPTALDHHERVTRAITRPRGCSTRSERTRAA